MAKKTRKERYTERTSCEVTYFEKTTTDSKPTPKPIRALTKTQHLYINSIKTNTVTFGIGPAGTGKTYIAASLAADMLIAGDIDKIIVTRPGVEAGESFGFLPGLLEEKYAPYIEPVVDVFNERLGKSHTEYLLKHGRISAKPLAFMRGCSFRDSLCILDEAQNTTPEQMKLFLTRIGRDCKVIIDGDTSQRDIRGGSGLQDAVDRLSGVPSIGVVTFSMDECVRPGICLDILRAYQD